MPAHLILATLAMVVGALDAWVEGVSAWITGTFLLMAVDVWIIVIVIGCTVIIIIVIIVRTSRRQ